MCNVRYVESECVLWLGENVRISAEKSRNILKLKFKIDMKIKRRENYLYYYYVTIWFFISNTNADHYL